MKKQDPRQLELFLPMEAIPRGDGSYTLRPKGPPQRWLWVREAAALLRVSPDAVRDWIERDLVTWRRAGRRKYQVELSSLEKYLRPHNGLE